MNEELREAVGKTIYVSLTLDAIPWEYLSETTHEYYRACADKAVEVYSQWKDSHDSAERRADAETKEWVEQLEREGRL